MCAYICPGELIRRIAETLIYVINNDSSDKVRSSAIEILMSHFIITDHEARAVCDAWLKRPVNSDAIKYVVRAASKLNDRVEMWKRILTVSRQKAQIEAISEMLEAYPPISDTELDEIMPWINNALEKATPKQLGRIVEALVYSRLVSRGGTK